MISLNYSQVSVCLYVASLYIFLGAKGAHFLPRSNKPVECLEF